MSCRTANAGKARLNIPRLGASLVILILAIVCGLSAGARGENAPLQIRLEKALENARAVTNVEIQYDDILWSKGRPGAPPPLSNDFTRTMHVTYTSAEGKYRTECRTESPSAKVVGPREAAFDGQLFATFETDSRLMSQQDGNPPGETFNPLGPLIYPFLFLSRDSDDNFPCGLRFTDLRSPDILNGLILPAAESSNGTLHVSFTGLPRFGVDQLWSISIDGADPDFRPKSISETIFAGSQLRYDFKTTYTFLDYTNLGAYYFPTRIAYSILEMPTNRLLAPTLSMTGLVTVVSFKIPTQIPDATFRLDESKAVHVWNSGAIKGYGVGIVLGEAGSNIMVKRIIADSPAGAQNELQAGDRILAIAESGEPAGPVHAGMADLPRAMAQIRGPLGTAVRLTIVPAGKDDSQAKVVTLVRGKVKSRLGGGPLLTNGMKAPDVEMVGLTDRAAEHLSDYAGKIIVLEFWASWCSPCQKAMADLQLDPARFPNWKDKVALVAASIDDTADIAAKHAQAKGWNQTHNVWLKTKDLQRYPLGGIPTAFIIDAKGTIVVSGFSVEGQLNIPEIVNRQLEAAGGKSEKN